MLTEKNLSFQLLKYVRPIWYFHLKPFNGVNMVWVDFDQLSDDEKELIQYDENYSNSILSYWDASYQALMRGVIKQIRNNIQTEHIELIPAIYTVLYENTIRKFGCILPFFSVY